MDIIYYLAGWIVLAIIIVLILGVIRPSWAGWAYRLFKKCPADLSRKFIIATALPALLVSGTVLGATEPASIKAERAAHEQATIAAEQKAKKDALLKIQAETKRLEAQKRIAEAEKKAIEEKKKIAEAEKQKAEAAAKAAADAQAQSQAARAETPAPAPQPVRAYSAPPSPAPAPVNTVHAGAYCSPTGATGVFSSGNPAVCAMDSKGARLRWQSP